MNDRQQAQSESYNRILRIDEVMKRTAISRTQIYHLASIGKFPRSIPLVSGGSSVGWVEFEINAYINERIQARTDGGEV